MVLSPVVAQYVIIDDWCILSLQSHVMLSNFVTYVSRVYTGVVP